MEKKKAIKTQASSAHSRPLSAAKEEKKTETGYKSLVDKAKLATLQPDALLSELRLLIQKDYQAFWPLYHSFVAEDVKKILFPKTDGGTPDRTWLYLETELDKLVDQEPTSFRVQQKKWGLVGEKILHYPDFPSEPLGAIVQAKFPYLGKEVYKESSEFQPAYAWVELDATSLEQIHGQTWKAKLNYAEIPAERIESDYRLYLMAEERVSFWKAIFFTLALSFWIEDLEALLYQEKVAGDFRHPDLAEKFPETWIIAPSFLRSYKEIAGNFLLLTNFLLAEIEASSQQVLAEGAGTSDQDHANKPWLFPQQFSFLAMAVLFPLERLSQDFRLDRSPLYQQEVFTALDLQTAQTKLGSFFELQKMLLPKNKFLASIKAYQKALEQKTDHPELREALGKAKELLSSLWILESELKEQFEALKTDKLLLWNEESLALFFRLPTDALIEIFGWSKAFFESIDKALQKKVVVLSLEMSSWQFQAELLGWLADFIYPWIETKIALLSKEV